MMQMTLREIEKVVLYSGSDDVAIFGGVVEGGIYCQQAYDEISPCILEIIKSNESIRNYFELGVAAGGTTFLFNHFFHLENIVLVDDNSHEKGRFRAKVLSGIKYQEIIGKSNAEETVRAVAGLKLQFDIMMIDGDHSYAVEKMDVLLYSRFLRSGGFLILHDSTNPEYGVGRIVKELAINPSMRFIKEFISKQSLMPLGLALFKKVF